STPGNPRRREGRATSSTTSRPTPGKRTTWRRSNPSSSKPFRSACSIGRIPSCAASRAPIIPNEAGANRATLRSPSRSASTVLHPLIPLMNALRSAWLYTSLGWLALLPLVAQEGEKRTWTSRDGRRLEASLVAVEDGGVRLRLADGKVATVPWERLSPADVDY